MSTPYQEPQPVVERVPSRSLRERLGAHKLSKPQLIGIGAGGVAAVGLLTYAALAYVHQNSQPTATPLVTSQAVIQPTTQILPSASPTAAPKLATALNGEMVDPGKENIHPLAVMIENHPAARPQSGLGQASLVYEAIAEGGITRFMAVYQDPAGTPVRVGPIRSSRTYFLHFANEIDAMYAHAGGNRDALDEIASNGTLNLDGLSLGSPLFTRDNSRNVATEHTLYSSTEKLWNYGVSTQHWSPTGDFKPWLFQDDIAADKRPAAQKVSVSVSSSEYDVVWQYDPTSNRYLRSMAGSAHVDANTGTQISVKNIVLETVDRKSTVTSIGEQGYIYTTTGSGPATIIQNGTSIKGTWRHDASTGRTRYFDANGTEVSMVRGTTWIHLTHSDSKISIQ